MCKSYLSDGSCASQLWNLTSLSAGSRWLLIAFALYTLGTVLHPHLHAWSHFIPTPTFPRWMVITSPTGTLYPREVTWLAPDDLARKTQSRDPSESQTHGAYSMKAISLPIMDLFFNSRINLWQSFSQMYLSQIQIIILLNQGQLAPLTIPVSLSVKEE